MTDQQSQTPKPTKEFASAYTLPEANRITRSDHPISRDEISDNALKVMRRISKAGFDAFLVGGAVRDLLLGKHPKDFDIATDATPEEVSQLFKNARIIGRRFRIVHVRFGREIIEVTTFRGHHDAEDTSRKSNKSSRDSSGMLLRDNVFGSIEEDAIRRDFTINALYYSSKDFSVYDFTNGIKDINARLLRIIGDPEIRFKEDPVRILRTARLAAKLGFHIEQQTCNAIKPNADLLLNIPPARLFDECLKIFSTGHGVASLELMLEHDLLKYLIRCADLIQSNPKYLEFIRQALINTDERIERGKSITPAFFYSVCLWPRVLEAYKGFLSEGNPPHAAQQAAAQLALQEQYSATAIPKRIQITIREIWDLQYRLEKRTGRNAYKLLEHPRFRAAYDFLLLREQAKEIEPGLGQWWTTFQQQNDHEREGAIQQLDNRPRKRNTRKRKPHPSSPQH